MGDCSTNNCNPCGPDYNAINQLAVRAGAYARQANTYAVDAENAWLEFNALYLGAFASAPTVDNEGDPLQTGALYWNTATNLLYAWNGTAWVTAANFNEFTPFLATGTPTARNLVTRTADVINVKDFGAVGDGVTDDTTAIQAAINYATSISGAVRIPSGNLFAVRELYIDAVAGCSIIGDRSGHSVYGTKGSNLLYTGTGTCISIADQSGLGNFRYRTFLSDISIFFAQNAFAGISAKNISECSFDRISVWAGTNTIQNGFKIDGGVIVFINQCTASNTFNGINLISGSSPNTQQQFGLYITQCNLYNHTNSILMGNSDGVNIYGNWIEAFQNAIFINNLSDTVTGLQVLALSINDNVIVQSAPGLTETRAIKIANYLPQEQFYIYGVINNNFIRMGANSAIRPTYAISVDMAGYTSLVDITLVVKDNLFFDITGSAIFADNYKTILANETNKAVAIYGTTTQMPITEGPCIDLSSSYTLLQNAVSLFAPNNTTSNTLFTATIPGGFIPKTGSIKIKSTWSADTSATNDFVRIRLGSATGPILLEKNINALTDLMCETIFMNANSKTSGRAKSSIISDSGSSLYSIDTTTDVSLNYGLFFQVEKANASRSISLTTFVIDIYP